MNNLTTYEVVSSRTFDASMEKVYKALKQFIPEKNEENFDRLEEEIALICT